MTDQEKYIAMLERFGLTYDIESRELETDIRVNAQSNEKAVGYMGFFFEFTFDNNGKFISAGAWE